MLMLFIKYCLKQWLMLSSETQKDNEESGVNPITAVMLRSNQHSDRYLGIESFSV